MLFIKEDGAVCLEDGENVIIFPLKKEELDLLLELGDKSFSNYIGVSYDGQDVWDLDFLKIANGKLDLLEKDVSFWEWDTIWLIVSARHKKIVGDLHFASSPIEGKCEISLNLNPKYNGQGITTSALSLIEKWAFQNGAHCLFLNCNTENEELIRSLDKNGFELIKNENKVCCYQKNKIIKFEREK